MWLSLRNADLLELSIHRRFFLRADGVERKVATLIDNDDGRDGVRFVSTRGGFVAVCVGGKCVVAAGHELIDFAARFAVDAHYREAVSTESGVNALGLGQARPAGHAPAREEVEHDYLATVI